MANIQQLVNRDFPQGSGMIFNQNKDASKIIFTVCDMFMNFDDFGTNSTKYNGSEIYLLDTCSFLKKKNSDFHKHNTYIVTCGVFLEIIQGCNHTTIDNGIFVKDLQKLLDLKNYLGNNLVFLSLGRKRRAYWTNCEPSQSCRNCVNKDKPHYKILRDVDTELFRLTNVINCQIKSCDNYLIKRISYHSKI